ncbi:hypothetical protein FACS189472_11230 [Alphaproteobacteria bacterium]|nr:hypothetical protein FACS189472_11230 [Alphaproteobacteria bacterium]
MYPYLSKVKVNRAKTNPAIQQLYDPEELIPDDYVKKYIPDKNLKPLKKFFRPSFSPKSNSWLIDIVFYQRLKIYLFALNVNTRFLVVLPIQSTSEDNIFDAVLSICDAYAKDEKRIHFKGDGERGFASLPRMFRDHAPEVKADFYFRKPTALRGFEMTNSYSEMDSVVRTIRNLVGRVSQYNPAAFGDENLMRRVVEIYNNTVHSAFDNKFTPTDVQEDFMLEASYIRRCKAEVEEVDNARLMEGMLTYEPGSIILVHLPLGKTPYKMQRRRRNFDELATFVRYEGGNVICDLLHPYPSLSRVIVPPYYTKLLASSIDEYRQKYNDTFLITPDNPD